MIIVSITIFNCSEFNLKNWSLSTHFTHINENMEEGIKFIKKFKNFLKFNLTRPLRRYSPCQIFMKIKNMRCL